MYYFIFPKNYMLEIFVDQFLHIYRQTEIEREKIET